ncbi:MAG: alcohol dehydrogenase [Omnitrophica bacterium RIFCSPHIGHO2_02_FULL_51_18]|nr:MAG: alcohol dehydrogenase [Omnitrophica bacterium RIFCSPHIGHO2_02_FULL_51_18]
MHDLNGILINPSTPILRAVQIIDASPVKIALAVDAKQQLRGTITDGDVRRGLLRGISLKEPVSRIMNRKPRFATFGEDSVALARKMQKELISQMPIFDARGRLVGIEILEDFLKPKIYDNSVLIMAGGLGNRLRPLTDHTPKPLLNVGKKPILETILENFVNAGFRKFFFSVYYKNQMFQEHFGDGAKWQVEIRYLKEAEKLGTAGALRLLPKMKKPIIVMNGDLLTKVDFGHMLSFHQENVAHATMCVREYDFQVPFGVVDINRHHIRRIEEKPVHRFFVNAGIYVFEPGVMKNVPRNTSYDMPRLFDKLLKKKANVCAFPIREYWTDIGRLNDLERANMDFSKVFCP